MSIPYVTDGVTDLDSALFNPIIDAANGLVNATFGIYNVLDEGAVGDGVTDDRAAFQTQLDAIYAAGGGTLLIPPGKTYKLGFRSGTYTSSFKVCCLVFGSNVTIDIQGDLLIDDVPGAGFFVFTNVPAAITPATVDSSSWWVDHSFVKPADGGALYPTYEIDPATAGENTITLATPAQHSNFAVDDAAFIRTGQTLSTAGEGEPDAELNEIAAINTGTGVLTLKYPLAKDYAQEYFPDSGRDEATTTSSTAFLALLGVQNVEPVIARNLAVTGSGTIRSEVTGHHGYAVAFGSVLGYTLDINVSGTNISPQTGGPYRNADLTVDGDLAFNVQSDVFLSGDRGCGDVRMTARCVNRGSFVGLVHIHEGVFNADVFAKVVNPPSASTVHAIQILRRSYDIRLHDPDIEHVTDNAYGIYIADDTCKRTSIVNPKRVIGLGISNSGDATRILNYEGRTDNFTAVGSNKVVLSTVIYHDSPIENLLGRIPAHSNVSEITVQVITEFNGTTPTLYLGRSLIFYDHFTDVIALDISPGMATVTFDVVTGHYQGGSGAEFVDCVAYYTADGSSAGKALVRVAYEQVQRVLGV
jgi:hypothetical protein